MLDQPNLPNRSTIRASVPLRHCASTSPSVERSPRTKTVSGHCSGCNTIAARYVESGEDPDKVKRIRAVLRERKKG